MHQGSLNGLFYIPRTPTITQFGDMGLELDVDQVDLVTVVMRSVHLTHLDLEFGVLCDNISFVSDHFQHVKHPKIDNYLLLKKHCKYILSYPIIYIIISYISHN